MRLRRGQDVPTRSRGSALTVALVMAVVFGGIATVASYLASRRSDQGQVVVAMTEAGYACESAAELLRAELVSDFENSGMIARTWMNEVRAGQRFTNAVREYNGFPGVRSWIAAVSPEDEPPWIEVVAATVPGPGTDTNASHRTRLNFANGKIFELAMLTDTADCMFCHMRITGDVGAVGVLRPGWGADNSGSSSQIDGSAYIKGTASYGTGGYSSTLNGTSVSGEIHENYDGSKIPQDVNPDGSTEYPTIDPVEARAEANGTVTVGTSGTSPGAMYVTPINATFDASNHVVASGSSLGPVVEGNLVLIGTQENPIRLDQHLFVTGDVVIKGYVDGKGALYAGRNLYVAGDVIYKDPPRTAGSGQDPDQIAREDVRDPARDELRLAARGNIVIGNYTYRPGSDLPQSGGVHSSLLPVKYRQGQDFITDQFGLWSTKYMVPADTQAGNSAYEVKLIGGQYFDDKGRVVPSSSVIALSGSTQNDQNRRYDSVIAPGQLLSNGTFQHWLSDEQYRGLLGTATYNDFSWRMPFATNQSEVAANLPGQAKESDYGSWKNISSLIQSDGSSHYRAVPSWTDGRGPGQGVFYYRDGSSLRVVENGNKTWERQVTHIDAFLFSNQRIAGKSVAGMHINGGMISREVGVLAPGNDRNWWARASANRGPSSDRSWWTSNRPGTSWPNNPYGGDINKFYLRYDYRLRNGGLGFDLIAQVMGDRVLVQRGGAVQVPSN